MSRRDRSLGLFRTRIGLELPSLIKLIQRGTITIADATSSNTATITAATLERSRLRHLGYQTVGGESNARNRLTLTNPTTITANRNGSVGDLEVAYEVTEYQPGVIKLVQ